MNSEKAWRPNQGRSAALASGGENLGLACSRLCAAFDTTPRSVLCFSCRNFLRVPVPAHTRFSRRETARRYCPHDRFSRGENLMAGLVVLKLYRDREVHGGRLSVQPCRLILPSPQGVLCGFAQKRRAGDDLDVLHGAGLVDQRIECDFARHAICPGYLRVAWQHRVNKAGRLNLAAYRERSVGRAGHGWAWQSRQGRINGSRRPCRQCRRLGGRILCRHRVGRVGGAQREIAWSLLPYGRHFPIASGLLDRHNRGLRQRGILRGVTGLIGVGSAGEQQDGPAVTGVQDLDQESARRFAHRARFRRAGSQFVFGSTGTALGRIRPLVERGRKSYDSGNRAESREKTEDGEGSYPPPALPQFQGLSEPLPCFKTQLRSRLGGKRRLRFPETLPFGSSRVELRWRKGGLEGSGLDSTRHLLARAAGSSRLGAVAESSGSGSRLETSSSVGER